MFEVTYISSFLGGLLTFFAPCTLPLIPAFIGFIGGQSAVTSKNKLSYQWSVFLSAALFVLGFTVVFIFFGLIAGQLGALLVLHKKLVAQVGGGIIILLGLGMLRVIPLPRMPFLSHLRLPALIAPGSKRGGFLLGLLFGLGWSPCLGPVLGTILVLAGTTGSALSGASLLFVYALGLGIPFLILAVLYGSALTYVTALQAYLPLFSRIGAVLIIIIGTLLLVGQFGLINNLLFDVYSIPAFSPLLDLM